VASNGDDSLILTPNQVRKYLSCSKGVLYQALRRKTIPSIRLSARKIVIPKVAFFRWLEDGGGDNLQE